MRIVRGFVLFAALAVLAGCTAVRVGEPYDPQMESVLGAYYKSAVEFVTKAQLNATKPEGRYGSPESNNFYSTTAATMAELKLRAQIVGGSRACPTIKAAGTVADAANVSVNSAAQSIGVDAGPPLDVSGNCTMIVIRNVEMAQANLEADHKEAGRITPAVANIDLQEIEAAVRVALQTIQSHK